MKHNKTIIGMIAFAAAITAHAGDCPSTPAAIKDIKAQGYYADAAKSVIDKEAQRQNKMMAEPLDNFAKKVAEMSDEYLSKHDMASGQCTLAWMADWAQNGALLGQMIRVNNDQSEYMRQWIHAGISISYLKVRAIATEQQKTLIDDWLRDISHASLAYWANPKKKRNNHYYWTGVGVTATAVATNDAELLQEARTVYEAGIKDIASDGSLPMEMTRGKRALHYHNYALGPLVVMAELARLDGLDWYAYDDHRIDLLANRVAEGYRDDTWFTERSGVEQEPVKIDNECGWAEFYRLQSKQPEKFDVFHAAAPFFTPRMGGNLTLMAQVGITGQKNPTP